MPNYQEGKIYKIYNTINDDIYVGSTTLKLCERMRDHRYCIKDYRKKYRLLYQAFREHGVEHFYIELIEKCPCNDKEELRKKEGEYIRQLKSTLNQCIAGRTRKEYVEDNKEQIAIKLKEYYEDNRERIAIRTKKYQALRKEDVREWQKRWKADHKEHLSRYLQEYWQKHKEELKQSRQDYRKLKITCECGCVIARGDISTHRKTKKHIELMNEIS